MNRIWKISFNFCEKSDPIKIYEYPAFKSALPQPINKVCMHSQICDIREPAKFWLSVFVEDTEKELAFRKANILFRNFAVTLYKQIEASFLSYSIKPFYNAILSEKKKKKHK